MTVVWVRHELLGLGYSFVLLTQRNEVWVCRSTSIRRRVNRCLAVRVRCHEDCAADGEVVIATAWARCRVSCIGRNPAFHLLLIELTLCFYEQKVLGGIRASRQGYPL